MVGGEGLVVMIYIPSSHLTRALIDLMSHRAVFQVTFPVRLTVC